MAQFQWFVALHFIPALGVMGSSPDIAEVITERVILAAGFIQSSLWPGLAKCFDSSVVFCSFSTSSGMKQIETLRQWGGLVA